MQRLYREERLTVRRRGGRKRAIGIRWPMVTPLAADQRWSLDFISDQLTDGRRFRILAVVDDGTRECLALVADTSISGRRVARELDDCGFRRCRSVIPRSCRSLFRHDVARLSGVLLAVVLALGVLVVNPLQLLAVGSGASCRRRD